MSYRLVRGPLRDGGDYGPGWDFWIERQRNGWRRRLFGAWARVMGRCFFRRGEEADALAWFEHVLTQAQSGQRAVVIERATH